MRPTEEVRRALDAMPVTWVRGTDWTAPRLPSTVERNALQMRARDLQSILRPANEAIADREAVETAVGVMLGAFLLPTTREDVQGYAMLLCDLPSWAVTETCGEFATGRATESVVVDGVRVERSVSVDFAPKAPRIHQHAERKVLELATEQARVRNLLNARLPDRASIPDDPKMRARVGELMQGLARRMSTATAKARAKEQALAAAALAESRDRATAIKKEADDRRVARYEALGLKVVMIGDIMADPDSLPEEHRYPREPA